MIDLNDIERLGKLKEKENYRFRLFLKENDDEDELDKQFKELHERYFKIYNCTKCRNCCKKIGTIIKEDELTKICGELKLDEKFVSDNFMEKCGEYTFKKDKCLFLDGNTCKVEKCLPIACREYPYTNQEERLFSLYSVISNASICPVVYGILEELKKIYKFR